MNDKLKNYSTKPNPDVWEKIQSSLRRRTLRRQVLSAAVGMTVVTMAILGVTQWPSEIRRPTTPIQPTTMAEANAMQKVIQTSEMSASAAVSEVKLVQPHQAAEPITTVAAPVPEAVAETKVEIPIVPKIEVVSTMQSQAPKVVPITSDLLVATPREEADKPEQVIEPTVAELHPTKSVVESAVSSPKEDTILWIPNVFIPSSGDDEINVFRVRLNHPGDIVNNYRMTIFNRGGSQVFMSNDINLAWDGTFRGREMQQGTYVYIVYFTDKEGLRHQRKGTITLIR